MKGTFLMVFFWQICTQWYSFCYCQQEWRCLTGVELQNVLTQGSEEESRRNCLKILGTGPAWVQEKYKSFHVDYVSATLWYSHRFKMETLESNQKPSAQELPETAGGLAWVGRKRLMEMNSIQIHNWNSGDKEGFRENAKAEEPDKRQEHWKTLLKIKMDYWLSAGESKREWEWLEHNLCSNQLDVLTPLLVRLKIPLT